MLEPISTLGIQIGFAALYSLARQSSLISREGDAVQQAASTVLSSVERSHALFGDKAVAISQIWALANECADPDWDGNDGGRAGDRCAGISIITII